MGAIGSLGEDHLCPWKTNEVEISTRFLLKNEVLAINCDQEMRADWSTHI